MKENKIKNTNEDIPNIIHEENIDAFTNEETKYPSVPLVNIVGVINANNPHGKVNSGIPVGKPPMY
jgi:hypothetical protein